MVMAIRGDGGRDGAFIQIEIWEDGGMCWSGGKENSRPFRARDQGGCWLLRENRSGRGDQVLGHSFLVPLSVQGEIFP